jgi:hypothetical protein
MNVEDRSDGFDCSSGLSTGRTDATIGLHLARRNYVDLLRSKLESFWRQRVDAQRRRLKRSLDKLMGRGHTEALGDVSVEEFHAVF